MTYVSPEINLAAFNCPHCRAFAHQVWYAGGAIPLSGSPSPVEAILRVIATKSKSETTLRFSEGRQSAVVLNGVAFSSCANCTEVAVWVNANLIHPSVGYALPANLDMPEDVRRDYDEASAILNMSPRGAAALIRLAIQKLCKELGQPGQNINDDIAALVKNGLNVRVQQALDTVRVIGNEAVHPGQIDLRDDRATVELLFKLLNLIVDKTISEPKQVAEIYESLPQGKLQAIERRDGPK